MSKNIGIRYVLCAMNITALNKHRICIMRNLLRMRSVHPQTLASLISSGPNTYRGAQSQALLNAIKDYDRNKWKEIGKKAGKPAKVFDNISTPRRTEANRAIGM